MIGLIEEGEETIEKGGEKEQVLQALLRLSRTASSKSKSLTKC
jgi:hypothetical protein